MVAPATPAAAAAPRFPAQPFTGDLAADRVALADCAASGERLLAELPAKGTRAPSDQDNAGRIHSWCRTARLGFLRMHTAAVYGELTHAGTARLRLSELAFAAAEAFPGLVPTHGEMALEAANPQATKEGREIDQGIFFHSVFRDPVAGAHLIETMLEPTPRAKALLADFRRAGELDLATVRIRRRGPAAHLTMRNTDALNAEDNQLVADLETAVDLALLDDNVSVGVLRGGQVSHPRYQGRRVFSAGINLKRLSAGQISFVDFLLGRELGVINKVARGISLGGAADVVSPSWPRSIVEKPWLAAVDTFAIGGGAQLLLVFDRVVAAADAYFSLPAAQEGIVPGLANMRLGRSGTGRLPRRLVLGGERVWAAGPDGGLLCDVVVEPERVDAAVEEGVRQLTGPGVVANRRMLHLAAEPLDRYREYLAEFALTQALRIYSPDVVEKTTRFAARATGR